MKLRYLVLGFCALVFFLLVKKLGETGPVTSTHSEKGGVESSPYESGGGEKVQSSEGVKDDRTPELTQGHDELAGYGDPDTTGMDDLLLVQSLIQIFRLYTKDPDALPTFGNKEIVEALSGENRFQDRFIKSDFSFISKQGEITDRWGSPLVFHFEAAHCPDIRSLGPDKTLWTDDDIVLPYLAE